MNKPKPLNHRALFNLAGLLVLVTGVVAAGIVYWVGQARMAREQQAQTAFADTGEWTDSSIPLSDSKKFAHDVELYNGKMGMLSVQLQELAQQPTAQAIFIIIASTAGALVCFFVARRTNQSPTDTRT